MPRQNTASKKTSALHAALGDPTREGIVRLLLDGEQAVGAIAEKFPVSRPAISKHLRLLQSVDLVTVRSEGTRNFYSVNPERIGLLRDEMDRMWEQALARFALVANNSPKPRARKK